MSKPILVAYATLHGSTKEVAEEIAKTLRESGQPVDFQALKDVRSLADYSAVVMGAPFYMFRWHKDARRFLSRHREALQKMPVAIFALGPFNDVEKEWNDVRALADKTLAKYPWLKPVSVEIVGGKFDPAHLKFPYNLIPAMKAMPVTDIRDWDKIRDWASSLPAKF
jgi:menaquinone-dependent protoporphyrinogen oxidase